MGEMIDIATLDGSGCFGAYVAQPEGRPRGGIVVIQEVFGINRGIRAIVDRWAAAGYVAIAHDLFWRVEPGIDLDPDTPGALEQAIGYMQRFDVVSGIADIEATIRTVREQAGGRKVGVVGYCFGGRLAYLAAARTDADASVGYYGGGIDAALDEANAIANPLLLHFAGDDHFIPVEAVAKIRSALEPNPNVTIEDYPGVDHGFATSFGSRRVEAAARLADTRTEAFFAQHLGG